MPVIDGLNFIQSTLVELIFVHQKILLSKRNLIKSVPRQERLPSDLEDGPSLEVDLHPGKVGAERVVALGSI
jgi:hypothetical protein